MPAPITASSAAYGSLSFAEQVAFFRRKLNVPTDGWTDIYTHEHDWAFVVAGANRDAIVADFRAAVEKTIADGGSIERFRRDFDRIVATHGWDYNGGRNWRSRIIYDTNLSTSYAAGRYEQLQSFDYWEYEHQDWVEQPRPEHVTWSGLVLSKDDPWWQTHYPPNGWMCHCTVRGRRFSDLVRMGKKGPDTAPPVTMVERTIGQRSINGPRTVRVPDGIDPGFEYAPGASRMLSAIPPEQPDLPGSMGVPSLPIRRPSDPLPPPRPFPSSGVLPADLPPEDYVGAFLARFGATLDTPVIFSDAIGERLVVGKELFQKPDGSWKAMKRDRHPFIALLAQALVEPDEIWTRIEWHQALKKAMVRRRYVARFEIDGQETPALLVFETGTGGWTGVTTFQGQTQTADDWRVGVRLYRRQ